MKNNTFWQTYHVVYKKCMEEKALFFVMIGDYVMKKTTSHSEKDIVRKPKHSPILSQR